MNIALVIIIIAIVLSLTQRKDSHRWNVGDILLCGETQWEVLAVEEVSGELHYHLRIVGSSYSDWYRVRDWDKLSCQKIN